MPARPAGRNVTKVPALGYFRNVRERSPKWTLTQKPTTQDVMCLVCAGQTPRQPDGRPRRYCCDACRQRAWRDRRATAREKDKGAGDEGGGPAVVEKQAPR